MTELFGAFGYATSLMVWSFPLAWFAMKDSYKLKPLFDLWRSVGISLFVLTLLVFLGIKGDTNSGIGVVMFFGTPIVVCALVLMKTGRQIQPVEPKKE